MSDITTVAPSISAAGITSPTFADILAYKQAQLRQIFGSDIVLDPDSMDGQLAAIESQAIADSNAVAIAVYNAFSPATAQFSNLSSVCKINGLTRDLASFSTVDVTLTGTAGTDLSGKLVGDTNNNQWVLPSNVVIPSSGSITVTATATVEGPVFAAAGTVTQRLTPMRGWQGVTNASDSTTGSPVESDAELRQRQAVSTALPSQTVADGLVGAVAAVPGVTRYKYYENDTDEADDNSIPAHSLSFVVEGGDAQAIATAIAAKKAPGVGTYGTTSETVTPGTYSLASTINFFRPTAVPVTVAITLTALANYTTTIGDSIKQAIADYINGLAIGQKVYLTKVYLPANLNGSADSVTFDITALTLNGSAADVAVAFNEVATCSTANVTITVS
jgi:uncharacterized phage protein gp47/JayE